MEVVYIGSLDGLRDYFIPRTGSEVNLALASMVTCDFELEYKISSTSKDDESCILTNATGPWTPETLQRLLLGSPDTLLEKQVTLKAVMCDDPENVVKTVYYCLFLLPIYEDLKQIRHQLNAIEDGPFKFELQRQSQLDVVEKYFEKQGWSHAYSTFLKILPKDQAVDPTERLFEIIDHITERRQNVSTRVASIYTTAQQQLLRSLKRLDNTRDMDEILFFMSFSYGYYADFNNVMPPIMVYFCDTHMSRITEYLNLICPMRTMFGKTMKSGQLNLGAMMRQASGSLLDLGNLGDPSEKDFQRKFFEKIPDIILDGNSSFRSNFNNMGKWFGEIMEITSDIATEKAVEEASGDPDQLATVSKTANDLNWMKDFAKVACELVGKFCDPEDDSLGTLDTSITIEVEHDDLVDDI